MTLNWPFDIKVNVQGPLTFFLKTRDICIYLVHYFMRAGIILAIIVLSSTVRNRGPYNQSYKTE